MREGVAERQRVVLAELTGRLTQRVIEQGHPADRELAAFFRRRRELGSRDRRFLSESIFSWFRWRGWVGRLDLPFPADVALSRMLDSPEAHPALADAVRDEWIPLSGMTIEEKADVLASYFPNTAAPLLEDLVPPRCLERLAPAPAAATRFVDAIQRRPPAWLRVRHASFTQDLNEAGIAFTAHPSLAGAVAVESGAPLASLKRPGRFVLQDIASQAVALAAAPESGSSWWDACCGAGGKALHLADLIGSEGSLLATDIRPGALKEVAKRARIAGVATIRTKRHDLNAAPLPGFFDGVLVDAPCSGWGTWGRNPDARWRSDPRDPQQKRNLQVRLLQQAAGSVKPGGRLVYAVCTVTREETVEVLERFLAECPQMNIEPFMNPLTGEMTDGTLQIWPWDGPGDGMYIARFRCKMVPGSRLNS